MKDTVRFLKYKLPLDEVVYMVRNAVVGDDEETRIDSEQYLQQIPKSYKKEIADLIERGMFQQAILTYVGYFFQLEENYKKVEERITTWVKEFEPEDEGLAKALGEDMLYYVHRLGIIRGFREGPKVKPWL